MIDCGRARHGTGRLIRLLHGREKPGSDLRRGDVVVVEPGEVIPGDAIAIDGLALGDESAVTGESAPVIPRAGRRRAR